MKRVATWAFYAVGALAIAYLALYRSEERRVGKEC